MNHHQATPFQNHQPLEEKIHSGKPELDTVIDRHTISIPNNADRGS